MFRLRKVEQRGRLALWLAMLAIVLPTSGGSCSDAFRVSQEPDVRVATVLYAGSGRASRTRYEIFGDGRVVAAELTGSPERVWTLFVDQLASDGVRLLFEDLIGSGLMEFDAEAVSADLKRGTRLIDTSMIYVTLRLECYKCRSSGTSDPVEKHFGLDTALLRAPYYPSTREIAAIWRLHQLLEDLWRKHRNDRGRG